MTSPLFDPSTKLQAYQLSATFKSSLHPALSIFTVLHKPQLRLCTWANIEDGICPFCYTLSGATCGVAACWTGFPAFRPQSPSSLHRLYFCKAHTNCYCCTTGQSPPRSLRRESISTLPSDHSLTATRASSMPKSSLDFWAPPRTS